MATPVAQPAAGPAAGVPAAQPGTYPAATPAAQPGAYPVATPVAQPGAYPAATPVAQPNAYPAATPVAQPNAYPTAATPVTQSGSQPGTRPAARLPEGVYYGETGNLNWIHVLDWEGDDDFQTRYETRYEITVDRLNAYHAIGLTRTGDGRIEREVVRLPSAGEILGDVAGAAIERHMMDEGIYMEVGSIGAMRDPEPQVEHTYPYATVKAITSNRAEESIFLKTGFGRGHRINVSPAQHDLILAELVRRCPQASVQRT